MYQADSPAAYYVRNSVFRLLEPSAITVSTGVSTAAPSPAPIAVKPVEPTPTVVQPPPAPKEEPAPEPVAPKENKRHRNKKEPQVAVPVAAPIPEPDTEIIMESVVVLIEDITGEVSSSTIVESLALQQIGQQLAELTEETIADKDSGPKSFADLFKTPQASAAAAVAAPAPKKGKNVSGNRPAAPKAEASPAVAPASKPITGVSLFIKQLPADITEAELMNIFVGASKVDIHPAKGYGFVEFPEPVFAASTMTRYQEDPNVFSHKGMRLRVEERSLQPKGPKPGVGQNRPVRDKTADKAEGPAAGSKSSAKNGNNSGPRKSAPAPKGEKLSSEWNVQGSGNKK